ncbi:MAG: UbiX family flavin prenyltransferase [Desulfitobacteriia bacterium]|jgi:4-hydroxy-3-polyprenylbenzoate decarboxylase
MKNSTKKRLIIGMSGASGAVLGISVLKALADLPEWESHLLISEGAAKTIQIETSYSLEEVKALATRVYEFKDIGASIASGTYQTEGMVIIPCSMKTLAGINSGYSDNLLLRAADVVLKERRKLVLVPRETPFNTIHLRNMTELSQMGVIMLPPMLTFYNNPQSIENMVEHITGKVLDIFGIASPNFKRWQTP